MEFDACAQLEDKTLTICWLSPTHGQRRHDRTVCTITLESFVDPIVGENSFGLYE